MTWSLRYGAERLWRILCMIVATLKINIKKQLPLINARFQWYSFEFYCYNIYKHIQTHIQSACLLTNVNTSRPHHICRHCVHHCQLPQLVVICGQQPKAIWTFRVQGLSHMVHVPSQFQVPCVGMHYRHP